MNRTKLIALSSVCAAVVLGCFALSAIPGTKWVCLILGVIASIATVIPIIISPKNIVFTMLVYVAGSILGMFLGIANVVCVVPIITFCIPFAIVKVLGETVTLTARIAEEKVLEDPFGNGDDKTVVEVRVDGKPKLPKAVKWALYYLLLECGIALTLLATYLFTPAVFQTIFSSKWFWWVVAFMQLIVWPYDVMMNGCLKATVKALQKTLKNY